MSVPVGRLGIRFSALVSVIMCVSGNSRTRRLHAPAPFAPGSDAGRGVPSESLSPENFGAL